MEIKFIVAAFCFMYAAAKSSMVEFSSEWKPNFGWEVVCSWNLYQNDTLQSVRLYRTEQQFMIYRPERDGINRSIILNRLTNIEFHVDCYLTQHKGATGKCIMSLEILQPVKDDVNYICEVSGERPTFRIESKTVNIEALVPPSKAVVENINQNDESSGRVNVNCSSTGLPAPNLVWTIGDRKIPQDFSGGEWNFTSKLYHVWSSLSYTPGNSNSHAICTPEILKEGKLVKGLSAQYSGASTSKGVAKAIAPFVLLIVALTR